MKTWLGAWRHWALFVLLLVSPRAAWGRDGEVVASLVLPSELLPSRICVHAAKLDPALVSEASRPAADLSQLVPGHAVFVKDAEPACSTESVCNYCPLSRGASGGVVCWLSPSAKVSDEPQRDLQLELVGAGLKQFRVEGTDVVMKVEFGDVQAIRVRSLGGAYFPSFAQAISNTSGTARLALRNRCVERPLLYSDAPDPDVVGMSVQSGRLAERPYTRGALAALEVPEEGARAQVTLKRGSTEYSGTFSYPSSGPVELLATKFSFIWRKSPFVTGRRPVLANWAALHRAPKNEAEKKRWAKHDAEVECPRVWLVREGVECHEPKRGEAKAECTYACDLTSTAGQVEFPARVRFELQPPRYASSDPPLKWEEDLRFPNASFSSLPPADQRRIYVVWPRERTEPGCEWDAIELTGPDQKTHRLENEVVSLPVHGLQSPATFGFRYLGRGPYRNGVARAYGDLLLLPEPSSSRQSVVVMVDAHVGTLYRPMLDARQWSPSVDADVAALLDVKWQVWLSGMTTKQPSKLEVAGAIPQWSSAYQVRLTAGVARHVRPSKLYYFDFGVGFGLATRWFESDWSRVKAAPTAVLRARFGYDVTRSLAIEPFVSAWIPETYVVQSQDSAGPMTPEIKWTYSANFGLGLRWADFY